MERVMGIEPTLAAWEAAVLPLNYTRVRPRVYARSHQLATARHPLQLRLAAQKNKAPQGLVCPAHFDAKRSESATQAQEDTDIVATLAPDADRAATEQLHAPQPGPGAKGERSETVVELHARHRIGQRSRDRLRLRVRLVGVILEFAVPGRAQERGEAVHGVTHLPASTADQRIEALLGKGERRGLRRIVFGKAVDFDALGHQTHH